MNIITLVTIC